jgi:hypothetical protein
MSSTGFKSLGRDCPICQGARRDCRESLSTGFVFCRHTEANPGGQWRYTKDDPHGFGIWVWGEGESADRPLRVTFTPPKVAVPTLPPAARDAGYRALIAWAGLSPEHRAAIAQRPHISEAELEAIAPYLFTWQGGAAAPSAAAGLPGIVGGHLWPRAQNWAIAIPNRNGQIVGAQIKNPQGGYFWASHADQAPAQLSNGELPIGVYGSPARGVVNLAEGFLKPAIAAARFGGQWVGAAGGNWASCPDQLKATLEAAGCKRVVLAADSGAVANPHVMGAYGRLAELLEGWGYSLSVRWWGQRAKADGDVDEITAEQYRAAKVLPWAKFARRFETVNRALDILKQQLPKADRETSGGYLPELPAVPAGFDGFAIDASMGAGKTTAIGRDIVGKNAPRCSLDGTLSGFAGAPRCSVDGAVGGFTIEIEPRNSLGEQAAAAHGLIHIHEMGTDRDSSQALGAMARDRGGMVLCPNSLPRAAQHIPAAPVVVIDEAMATLTEALEGSTLKGRYANTIGLLFSHMRQASDLHISESNLDQPTLDLVQRVTGKRLFVVRHHGSAAPWQVHLSVGGSPSGMFGQMVASLEQGQNIWLTATSLDELAAWEIWAQEHDIKSLLITGETNDSGRFSDFFKDPDTYLEQNQTQLLLTNQSVQTGLSVERYRFDAVYGYGPGFAPETIYQQLGRYRQPCPRYVWVPAFITPSRWEKPQRASVLAEVGRELSQWAAKGFGPVAGPDPDQAAIDDYLAARWEIAWAQKVVPGQALTLMLERAGHAVTPWEPEHCDETAQLRKDNREKLAQQRAQFHAALELDQDVHTPAWVKSKRDDTEATYRDRCILRKLETLEKFPGINWDSPEIWYQAWFAPRHHENGEQISGPVAPGAALWAECGHVDYLQGKAGDEAAAIIGQRLRSIKLLPEYGAKLAILAPMRPLAEQILASGKSSPDSPLVKRLGAMARAVGDDLYRYLRITAGDDQSDQAIAHKILRKFGLCLERTTYRTVGRKRQWCYAVTAPPLWRPLVEARQKAIEALQAKAHSGVTDLLEERSNKSVTATSGNLPPGALAELLEMVRWAKSQGAAAVADLKSTIAAQFGSESWDELTQTA